MNKEPEFNIYGLTAKVLLRNFHIGNVSVKPFYNYKDEYRSFVTREEVHSGGFFLLNESFGLTLGYELGHRRLYEAIEGAYLNDSDRRYEQYINVQPYWSHIIYAGLDARGFGYVLLKANINPVDASFGVLADMGGNFVYIFEGGIDTLTLGARFRGMPD
jgi:hypothetical protein